ncbi:MAG: beta-propeller fold lactonase family protein [Deltaproteobacteria bacterium]|nr:beta-propeller fold lactonase family protein [Deltaproteobacteria bacterium]
MSDHKNTFAYIGNRSKKRTGCGFGICRYHAEAGQLEPIKSVFHEISVGATCLDSKRNILYCTNEIETHPGYASGGGGQVYAFAIDPETGDLTEINHQPSYATLPCSVAVDGAGKYLIATNHSGHTPITKSVKDASGKYRIVLEFDDATTILYPLNDDGSIGDPCDIYKHSGKGPLPVQTHPHPHSVMMSPSGNLFAVCDKGSDQIFFFRINRETSKLEICGDEGYPSIPGSSPRYSVFHPRGPYFYMNHENKAVIRAFRYDEEGKLEPICTVNALPDDCEDHLLMQSDIKIHPSGKYLYDLIRGINAVSVFEIKEETGEIEKIQTVTLDGTGPRGCAICPDGRFLHIAALTSKDVLVWAIGKDGKLSPTGQKIGQPNPGNVTFFSV